MAMATHQQLTREWATPENRSYLLCAARLWPGLPPPVHELVLFSVLDPFLCAWELATVVRYGAEALLICAVPRRDYPGHGLRLLLSANANGWFDLHYSAREGSQKVFTPKTELLKSTHSTHPLSSSNRDGSVPTEWPHVAATAVPDWPREKRFGTWLLARPVGRSYCVLKNKQVEGVERIDLTLSGEVRYAEVEYREQVLRVLTIRRDGTTQYTEVPLTPACERWVKTASMEHWGDEAPSEA
eukprot:TRINITY_DN5971_c0_g1_i2.p1 TRINITY_DN5971_c0_g1~~TRINITY_DN5971_c0_g1_i2.p1  ORF type:complete len:242 (+),score=27.80 TRINITY_DN5971_c0_g1_i2:215-940(+)